MNKYRIILDVYKTRSISKTAQRLNYTQSAISQAIKNFENELGFQLFRRSKAGMELITGMEEIICSLENICREEDKISRFARNLTTLDSGYIRIGSVQSVSYNWLPNLIRDFSDRYSNIRFELTIDGITPLKAKLDCEQLDCVFTSKHMLPGYPFMQIDEDEMMLVMPENHRLAGRESISVSDIDYESFVMSSNGLDEEAGIIFEENHIIPNVQYQPTEDFAALKMVELGFGITIIPRLFLTGTTFHIYACPFEEHYTRILGIAYSPDKPLSPATRKFLAYIKSWNLPEQYRYSR
ncbi:LysR family transcriptional regulator [Extibacter muris]|uniref:LysR family transcriptional regulator n=1 Tax=Extibacter muris TaxID=1796622 RepID=UPI001D07870A|nr:LysR family transcriptional regulator [Extibacter muris]MCB6200760.1 LysR family transcriptional regulator [Extibacter muris]MCQ4662091.1 LysR family transcriptional regulator [Extibacter muris]MCQ4691996.1 LysR family transcriptional regulator [Extibacter muris]